MGATRPFGAGSILLLASFLASFLALPSILMAAECSNLQVQLEAIAATSLERSHGQRLRYDAAITRQEEQLAIMRQRVTQAGCARGILARAGCPDMLTSLDRMAANLSDLQRQRAAIGNPAARDQERLRITSAMRSAGCSVAQPRPAISASSAVPAQATTSAGRYRTLCVRTCDGYYFPVSYGVSQSSFARDQQNCAAMCQGARVELHYQRIGADAVEDMVSIATGLRYGDLSTAFDHRRTDRERPQGCGCGASAGGTGYEVVGGGSKVRRGFDDTVTAALTDADDGESDAADTSLRRSSGSILVLGEQPALPAAPTHDLADERSLPDRAPLERSVEASDRAVRVVGPRFFPDPEPAIDLQARDPYRAR